MSCLKILILKSIFENNIFSKIGQSLEFELIKTNS